MFEMPLSYSLPGFAGRIGIARADITPEPDFPLRNWGAALHSNAVGIHRPLTATALTLQQPPHDTPLVLLTLDLGWWLSYKDEWYLRGYLLESLDLDPAHLMVSLTHTHAGPSLWRGDPQGDNGSRVTAYLDGLRQMTQRCIETALSTADIATLDWAFGHCGLAQNRDFADPAAPRFLCGYNPDAFADDTLLVGRVTGQNGARRATLVNYACHPTTLAWENRLISPDYVGAMREIVETHTEGAPCLFLQGASGELAPREQYTADTGIADVHGRQLGYSVLSILEGMLPPQTALHYQGFMESGAPLAIWGRTADTVGTGLNAQCIAVEMPLKKLPTWAEMEAQIRVCTDNAQKMRLLRKRLICEGVGEDATVQMPVWVWNIGNCVIIGQPNEAYSDLQRTLRLQFPQKTIVVMNVVNGHYGYLPPATLYTEDIYSVWQTPFATGSLERLIASCASAIFVPQAM
jgi:hypothetical protein